jgi:hypothetical protein
LSKIQPRIRSPARARAGPPNAGVPQNREEFRGQLQMGEPRLPAGRNSVKSFGRGQGTARIVGGDRAGDEFFGVIRELHEQADAPLGRGVDECDRCSVAVRLVNGRKRPFHVPGPAVIRDRCGQELQHERSVPDSWKGNHSFPCPRRAGTAEPLPPS